MEFSRQEYWSGKPLPSPRDLPHPGIEPQSPSLQVDSLPSEPPGKPHVCGGRQNTSSTRRPQVGCWVRKTHWRRDRLPTSVFSGLPCGSAGKESASNVGDLGLIPGEGKGYPLQFSGLDNSTDYKVHGVAKSWT